MRLHRLLSLLAAILMTATLLAPSVTAEPPFRLPDTVIDNTGVLSERQLADVQKSVDQLYSERHVRLWVVFVESFAPQGAVGWAQQTRTISDLSNEDAILAVATGQRSYAFLVPSAAAGGSSTKVDDIRRDRIEPALRNSDWVGAATAAATGLANLGKSGGTGGGLSLIPMVAIAGIGLLVIAALMLWSRRRRAKRHEADVAAAKNVDPTDPEALASVPIGALDDLSKSIVVEVDNAVRTSANELVLAVEEFGDAQTAPFAAAVDSARTTLKQAFAVRQKLDDDVPEPLPERRDLLTRVVVSAAKANRELETQTASFHQMRDLVFNAPERLDTLTQQLVTVTARLEPSDQKIAQLRTEFDESALASVARNVNAARERVEFADKSITRGRELAAKPVAGEVDELVDCVRGAESSLQQANTMLDAIDSAASDIRKAVSTLPAAVEDIQRGITQASEQLAQGGLEKATELSTARDAAVRAVASAQTTGATDPLGAFTLLTQADADLDRLLAGVAEERDATERLNKSYEQALFTAQSRVRSVSDYIDTRRGSVGPEARTRFNEAVRQLDAAQTKSKTNITEAIAHANGAAMLAAQAQQLANDDVQAGQREYQTRDRGGRQSDMGAMVGGIILGNILTGGGGFGGGGGWTSTSYGGSSGGGGDGGLLGGGGRF
ncbi:TPM domain-containing protein [Mycolicibacterium sp.]|uniref:TPM domain-containing protein n=1 Tax=Mycolicibacterium sp. TaxID=2320850 RepID=UPI001A338BCF|nr:TPM domain-containing protein [Mycolicibacterium sp.]MBJ7398690.1 TPM domain-containing protein [Mycolicibacterium sp.]